MVLDPSPPPLVDRLFSDDLGDVLMMYPPRSLQRALKVCKRALEVCKRALHICKRLQNAVDIRYKCFGILYTGADV